MWGYLERFSNSMYSCVQGVFYFHSGDEDLSPETRFS
jgi:hypothetical protein